MIRRARIVSIGIIALHAPLISAAEISRRPLTVAAALETRRILPTISRFSSGTGTWEKNDIVISPDGTRFAAMLVCGDSMRNGVHMQLVAGGLGSLQAAADLKYVARLFTSGLGPFPLTYRFDYRLTWLPDNRRIAFLAQADDGTIQVASADVPSRAVRFITSSPTDVAYFDIDDKGNVLYTTAEPPSKAAASALIRQGFAVTDLDARSLLSGFPNGTGRVEFKHFLASVPFDLVGSPIELQGGSENLISPQLISFSPDGRRAILDSTPPSSAIPESWASYSDPLMSLYAKEAHQPGGGRAWIIQRLYVLDTKSRTARPLWNAPKQFVTNQIAWSPDSLHIALGPTFLPDAVSGAGAGGTAIAVVNVMNGTYTELRVPQSAKEAFHVARWKRDGAVELENTETTITFRNIAGRWELTARRSRAPYKEGRSLVRVAVKEGMHRPQRLFAVDAHSNRQRLILDLNPDLLERFSLGAVEMIDWQDNDGRAWHGRLYLPVSFSKGKRYPLVLQSGGIAPSSQFSLYGPGGLGYVPGLGPPGISIYAAQALANRGIAVLQVEDKTSADSADFHLSPQEPRAYTSAYEAAIASLTGKGWVDPARIGISGFSRTGWYVEYALTHSSFPFAAGLVSDNLNGGYLQASLIGAAGGLTGEFAQDNGAVGIGEGLKVWLENAPAFNAQKIRAPLRKQVESGGLHNVVLQWEMFNALSLLGRPVELYVVPDIERGSHNLQNPRQIIASAEGAVDWFGFWLNGYEDPDASKADRYARWRKLRQLPGNENK